MNTNIKSIQALYFVFMATGLVLMVLVMSTLGAQAQTGIEGKWKDAEKGTVFLIYQENGKYFGQLISSEDPAQNEKIQSQEKKIVLLKNFEKKSDNKYCCGTIYQPQKKKTLSATLTIEGENTLKVKAKYGFMSATRIWKRV